MDSLQTSEFGSDQVSNPGSLQSIEWFYISLAWWTGRGRSFPSPVPRYPIMGSIEARKELEGPPISSVHLYLRSIRIIFRDSGSPPEISWHLATTSNHRQSPSNHPPALRVSLHKNSNLVILKRVWMTIRGIWPSLVKKTIPSSQSTLLYYRY